MCVGGQWSKDNLWELVLSFNHVDPGDTIEESRLDNKYPWCYLASLVFLPLYECICLFKFWRLTEHLPVSLSTDIKAKFLNELGAHQFG